MIYGISSAALYWLEKGCHGMAVAKLLVSKNVFRDFQNKFFFSGNLTSRGFSNYIVKEYK